MSTNGKVLVLVVIAGLLIVGAASYFVSRRAAEPIAMTVYTTRECVCCGQWVAYMKKSGFYVTTRYMSGEDLRSFKDQQGVPLAARSCHSAEVRGYLIEGHTPADAIRRLLRRQPELAGIAVPGMPVGSPGMEIAGRQPRAYNVVGFRHDGAVTLVERR